MDSVWGIAYIKSSSITLIDGEIEKSHYPYVRAAIPRIRILQKKFKNHQYFVEVPLLFNYGFLKIPYDLACDTEGLKDFKSQINSIHNWFYNRKAEDEYRIGEEINTLKRVPKIYTVTHNEVMRLMRLGKYKSIYHAEDINSLTSGTLLFLKGYPFEGLKGELISVNPKKEEARVKIFIGSELRIVTVGFGNLFYSVYEDYFGLTLNGDKTHSFNEEFYGD